jgi:hypothetical protein
MTGTNAKATTNRSEKNLNYMEAEPFHEPSHLSRPNRKTAIGFVLSFLCMRSFVGLLFLGRSAQKMHQ